MESGRIRKEEECGRAKQRRPEQCAGVSGSGASGLTMAPRAEPSPSFSKLSASHISAKAAATAPVACPTSPSQSIRRIVVRQVDQVELAPTFHLAYLVRGQNPNF